MKRALIAGLVLCFLPLCMHAQDTDMLLDSLQHAAFNYFWFEANPMNGLVRDRASVNGGSGAPCSIAATGFGLSAICIAIDHGWITRETGRDRILTTLKTFWNGVQGTASSGMIGYQGFFYHFLDVVSATRTWSSELSSIDTGLLLAGVLDAREYFSLQDSLDTLVRSLADSLYRRVNWDWMRNGNAGILMGWKPETGFSGFGEWLGYNEAMILYILALGSPTHAVPATAWFRWVGYYSWQTLYGYSYVIFPPLFGHQYSHCWIDFRNIRDNYMRVKGSDYFENSRRATYAQRAYCLANPGHFTGYGDSLWGLTAGDGPTGYVAHGAPPAENDDGTLAPTAVAGSLPFAPEIALPALRNMYRSFTTQLWGVYGFRDAFNLSVGWWDSDVIGIDEGPIVLMIENYRVGSVWSRIMKNSYVQQGLAQAGFQKVTDVAEEAGAERSLALQSYPNPFNPSTLIRYVLPSALDVHLAVFDLLGRERVTLVHERQAPGSHSILFDGSGLSSGAYIVLLRAGASVRSMPILFLK